ncbi:MAG TPA: hypothetical protein VL500_02760 [Candidatus Eisenbacteria bacterium]|nr:hypothetical protein [Candidatus Eisenbacteria bacterium]
MQDHTPKPGTIAAAIIVPAVLVLLGAGCFSVADKLSNDAVLPVKTSVDVLNKAKTVTAEQSAKANEEAEMVSDDVSVALILTENTAVPAGADVQPGIVGCNDKVAYVKEHRAASTDSIVHDALMTLFSLKDSNRNDLYNALWQSDLAVDKIQSRDGVVTEVWLKGKTQSGGACDDPRIKAQIEATISRFKPKFKIFLNGTESAYRCLGDQSGECK